MLLADRVALLAGGTLAAVGSHRELLETVPVYRSILSAQPESGRRGPALPDLEVVR